MLLRPALINVMMKAAEKAAKGLRRDFGELENLQISRKGPADFVTNADLRAQEILREELGKARPSFGFLMEEEDSAEDTSDRKERWIVDPLDGTTNFLHGVPHWSISIAVEKDGEIISGLVFDPLTDEAFWAEKGIGAFCSNRRLRVSGRETLGDCLIGTAMPYKSSRRSHKLFESGMKCMLPKVSGVRGAGSAALALAYVAAGRYDAAWMTGLMPWDMAAGLILIKEAGGVSRSLKADDNPLETGEVLVSNMAVSEKFTALIREAHTSLS